MNWDPVWENIFTAQEWGKYPSESLVRCVASNFYSVPDRKRIRILEVGCGPGRNIWFLAREGFSFAGIDGSITGIVRATRRLDEDVPDWRSRGELRVGDIANLPFADASFDAVIDVEATYANSWEAAKAIFSGMARVTKPGGKLYSQTFATGCWGDGTGQPAGHGAWHCSEGPLAGAGLTRFTKLEQVSELIGGFEVESVELLRRSANNRRKEIREWVIFATKKP
jgi:SAM-dependent methyltransferase